MIMISTDIEFDEFMTRLKDKFGFRRKTRCKIRDEDGDGMISVSDQEDLDMAISTSKKNAKRDRSDTGKLEVSSAILFRIFFSDLPPIHVIAYRLLTFSRRFGSKKSKGSEHSEDLDHRSSCPFLFASCLISVSVAFAPH